MARRASPEYEQAKALYIDSGGEMPLVDIAAEVGKSPEQIRKWKSSKKWDDELAGTKGNVTKSKGNVTESAKGNVTESKKRRGGQKGNQNAAGGRGNPNPRLNYGNAGGGAPEGNENAVTHGFFRSKLPQRLQKLHEQVCEMDLVDMAWNNLTLTMTVILDSLEQLLGQHRDRSLVKKKRFAIAQDGEGEPIQVEGEWLQEVEWEHHTSLEQNAKAFVALDRMQARLDGQIRRFLSLADEGDKRRFQLELMQQDLDFRKDRLTIEQERLEIEKAKLAIAMSKVDDPNEEDYEDDGFMEAMKGGVAEVWSDDQSSDD